MSTLTFALFCIRSLTYCYDDYVKFLAVKCLWFPFLHLIFFLVAHLTSPTLESRDEIWLYTTVIIQNFPGRFIIYHRLPSRYCSFALGSFFWKTENCLVHPSVRSRKSCEEQRPQKGKFKHGCELRNELLSNPNYNRSERKWRILEVDQYLYIYFQEFIFQQSRIKGGCKC